MEKKYLTVPFSKFKANDGDDYFRFEGYASTYDNVDRGSDKVVKGAFENTLKSKKPSEIKVYFQHDAMQPLGVVEELRDDEKGLFIRAKMPKDHLKAREVMSLMKCGAIDSMSIGYIPVKWNYDEKGIRELKEIDLYEVSPVTMPMNPKAIITDMKSVSASKNLPLASRSREWDADSAISRVRRFTKSEDEPSSSYRKAFMYFESDKSGEFTAYKLPFADIIDGKMYAIPRAIFAVAAALKGARGGVEIPASDKSKIKAIVNHYYSKMDMESPLKASYEEEVEDENDEIDEREDDAERFAGEKSMRYEDSPHHRFRFEHDDSKFDEEEFDEIQDEEDDLEEYEEELTEEEDEIHEEEDEIHEELHELSEEEEELEEEEREAARKKKKRKRDIEKEKRARSKKKPMKKKPIRTREKEEDYEDFAEDWEEEYKPSKRGKSASPCFSKKFLIQDVLNIKTKRDFERCLRESGAFSGQAAVKLASFFSNSRELKKKKVSGQFKEIADLINKL